MSRKVVIETVRIILLCLLLSSCGSAVAEFDWPSYRGPDGNGVSLETGWDPEALEGGPKILWRVDIGFGYSNVVLKGSQLYASGRTKDGHTIICLNADSGKEIWRYTYDSLPEPQSTPTLDGKSVYTIDPEGRLICLSSRNGKLRWEKNLVTDCDVVLPFYGYGASVLVEGNLLILTANSSGLALDKKTGREVWGSERPPEEKHWEGRGTGTDYSTPVVYDYGERRLAALSSHDGMQGVDVETGEVIWTYEWETYKALVADPIIFDQKVFVSKYVGLGSLVLDIRGGAAKRLWKNNNLSGDISSSVQIDGFLFGCDGGPEVGSGVLQCLDIRTGELKWEEDLRDGHWDTMMNASLISAAGKLIILEDSGTLHIAEAIPTSYQEISRCELLEGEPKLRRFWTHPVLCNGKMYCRNYTGDLICIDVSI